MNASERGEGRKATALPRPCLASRPCGKADRQIRRGRGRGRGRRTKGGREGSREGKEVVAKRPAVRSDASRRPPRAGAPQPGGRNPTGADPARPRHGEGPPPRRREGPAGRVRDGGGWGAAGVRVQLGPAGVRAGRRGRAPRAGGGARGGRAGRGPGVPGGRLQRPALGPGGGGPGGAGRRHDDLPRGEGADGGAGPGGHGQRQGGRVRDGDRARRRSCHRYRQGKTNQSVDAWSTVD